MKKKALVVCPGRGTYNSSELGYLARYHRTEGALNSDLDFITSLDAMRRQAGQPTINELDGAEAFKSGLHMRGDNASLLIYACALADFQAIDRERYDIVAVTGNSMGWYLSLACAGALSLEGGGNLVHQMGNLMQEKGTGSQIVYPLVDDDWRVDGERTGLVALVLQEATDRDDMALYVSIHLGGMIVLAGDDAGLSFAEKSLPKLDRFPMRLGHHSAFHSPLLDHVPALAQPANSASAFGNAILPMIDGRGKIWEPRAYDPADLYDYTLGHQINRTYDFTKAVEVGVREFGPDEIIVLGPGTTMGAPVAQTLIGMNWRGMSDKADFQNLQKTQPILLGMGIDEQRVLATG